MLSETQKKKLLEIARNSITEYVRSKQRIPVETEDPLFREHRGAFVTIHKDGALRGCIGRIVADHPLIEVVNAMAVEAATGDPRFPPVQPAEIDTLDLEISVLSPIKQISDVQEIEVGTHGLIIRKGLHSGLLLPQVATDYGWNREEFLQHTCLKAGLNPQAWKQNAQIYIFSAEVFGENE